MSEVWQILRLVSNGGLTGGPWGPCIRNGHLNHDDAEEGLLEDPLEEAGADHDDAEGRLLKEGEGDGHGHCGWGWREQRTGLGWYRDRTGLRVELKGS